MSRQFDAIVARRSCDLSASIAKKAVCLRVIFLSKRRAAMKGKSASQKNFVLQKVQPALLGLLDGAVSTLPPERSTSPQRGACAF
jgi:hypothetical protein